jgi:hypothetical protein
MRLPRGFLASGTGATALVLAITGGALLLTSLPVAFLHPRLNPVWPLVAPCALLAAGLLLGALRAAVVLRRERLRRVGCAAPGVITGLRQNHLVRVNRRNPWKLRFRYEVTGTWYESEEELWEIPPGYGVGEPVGVVYEPGNPGRGALQRI